MRWIGMLALVGCGPNPGEDGYSECSPISAPEGNCVVWYCFEANGTHEADLWVQHGEDGRLDCTDASCQEEIGRALELECGVDLTPGLPTCREDCCETCREEEQACGDECIDSRVECEVTVGCACEFDEACT
jgi:hypothetical protein